MIPADDRVLERPKFTRNRKVWRGVGKDLLVFFQTPKLHDLKLIVRRHLSRKALCSSFFNLTWRSVLGFLQVTTADNYDVNVY
jgi:hypothetical protein